MIDHNVVRLEPDFTSRASRRMRVVAERCSVRSWTARFVSRQCGFHGAAMLGFEVVFGYRNGKPPVPLGLSIKKRSKVSAARSCRNPPPIER